MFLLDEAFLIGRNGDVFVVEGCCREGIGARS
jgi:hypothetical protein